MDSGSWFSKSILLPTLLVGIAVLGVMVPTFYDWSGANQSRPSPQTATAFYAIIGFAILAWLSLPWLPSQVPTIGEGQESSSPSENRKRFQFNIRSLVVITSLLAIVIAGLTSFRLVMIAWIISLSIYALTWFVMHDLSSRLKWLALVGCMYLPYLWVLLPSNVGDFGSEHIFAALGLPTFVPSIFLGRFLGYRIEESLWLFTAIAAIELAIGVWVIRLGPRRGVAWIMLVLILSFIGSCFLNAAVRA